MQTDGPEQVQRHVFTWMGRVENDALALMHFAFDIKLNFVNLGLSPEGKKVVVVLVLFLVRSAFVYDLEDFLLSDFVFSLI